MYYEVIHEWERFIIREKELTISTKQKTNVHKGARPNGILQSWIHSLPRIRAKKESSNTTLARQNDYCSVHDFSRSTKHTEGPTYFLFALRDMPSRLCSLSRHLPRQIASLFFSFRNSICRFVRLRSFLSPRRFLGPVLLIRSNIAAPVVVRVSTVGALSCVSCDEFMILYANVVW